MMKPGIIREKIYSGLLGKAVGVRLGAPVEPTLWDHDRILSVYGDLDDYVRNYKNFAADDDTNGPLVFIRALWDEGDELTPQSASRAWLNYIGDGHGMLWWGGFGVSSEETAYRHLQSGKMAPETGSIALRGIVESEQIGGQIFSDCWGWVCPGDPIQAAKLARTMASVSHDGEALNGAAYVASATAAAFTADHIEQVHSIARAQVSHGSHYAKVIDAVADFHRLNSTDWRACFRMLERDFGYDKWPGICHIIPNAGVVVLALLYGQGDMPKTALIATMCGWDTDCNAGNAANIAGVFQGVKPHWAKWRKPINDTIITSAVTGALNIVDMPSAARDFAVLAIRRRGGSVPGNWNDQATARGVNFDFALPGATHGIRTKGSNRLNCLPNHSQNALDVQIDRWDHGDKGCVFWKPFYRRSDFDDNRYRPMLSPVVASGQNVEITLKGTQPVEGPREVFFRPYVRFSSSQKIQVMQEWERLPKDWTNILFSIPLSEEAVDEIGIEMEHCGDSRVFMSCLIRRFSISGIGHTIINPSIEAEEWGSISRFSFNRGTWRLVNGAISGSTETDADLWTGHSFATDQVVTAKITRTAGHSHLVTARASGNERYYAAGIVDGMAVILRENFGSELLVQAPVDVGETISLEFSAIGEQLSLRIDGMRVVEAVDGQHKMGMAGLRMGAPGIIECSAFDIREV